MREPVPHRVLAADPDAVAPDGSEVRLLACGERGSMSHFRLAPGTASRAVQHATVEELWFFVAGRGEMCVGDAVVAVGPGVSLCIPPRTRFQFRNPGPGALDAVGVTMDPWPGDHEALDADAYWPPAPPTPS